MFVLNANDHNEKTDFTYMDFVVMDGGGGKYERIEA